MLPVCSRLGHCLLDLCLSDSLYLLCMLLPLQQGHSVHAEMPLARWTQKPAVADLTARCAHGYWVPALAFQVELIPAHAWPAQMLGLIVSLPQLLCKMSGLRLGWMKPETCMPSDSAQQRQSAHSSLYSSL